MILVAGLRGITASLHVPRMGAWFIDVDMADETAISGRVTIKIGGTPGEEFTLVGTIQPDESGSFGLRRRLRIIGGAGGWQQSVPRKDYANDAGVSVATIVADLARETGETLAAVAPAVARLESHYARQAGAASTALEDAIGADAWWIDFDGKTHVGSRPAATATSSAYQVLDADLRNRTVTLACDDLRQIGIGSIISTGLDEPLTIGSYSVEISESAVRLMAWCGDSVRSRLVDNLLAIIDAAGRGKLWGTWRYRVIGMNGDRVSCQRLSGHKDLPDLISISMVPGVAGAHAELPGDAEVYVEFLEGDRDLPRIVGFAGKDGIGHVPDVLHLCGGDRPVAHTGDTVNFFFPAVVPVAGTISGSPFTGTITITTPGVGVIRGGQTKLRGP